MRNYTEEEIKTHLCFIEAMDQVQMAKIWRMGSNDETEIYFRTDYPTGKAFYERLFNHFYGIPDEVDAELFQNKTTMTKQFTILITLLLIRQDVFIFCIAGLIMILGIAHFIHTMIKSRRRRNQYRREVSEYFKHKH